ncbi:MAG: methionine ABC transporter substrate-binding protein, partial [Campylobacter sp.]|nr:methionine ABC transporter substrate-binding protein [Campylobacter sp.]
TKNPKNLKFKEIEAATLPRTLDDVDIAVINTNFAMNANLNPTKDALVIESKESPYVNIVVVKDGNQNKDSIKALNKALQTQALKDFIAEKYKGSIVPAF